MTDREPQLVLDVSAIAAWTSGSITVGELLAEIDQDHGCVIVPLTCLVKVASSTLDGDRAWLDLLVQHPAAEIVTDDPADWRMLAGVLKIIGSAPPASAAWHALERGIDVLTRHPGIYQSLGGDFVLGFDD